MMVEDNGESICICDILWSEYQQFWSGHRLSSAVAGQAFELITEIHPFRLSLNA